MDVTTQQRKPRVAGDGTIRRSKAVRHQRLYPLKTQHRLSAVITQTHKEVTAGAGTQQHNKVARHFSLDYLNNGF